MQNYTPTKLEIERDISELLDIVRYSDEISDNEDWINQMIFEIKCNIQKRIQIEKGEREEC